MSSPLLPCPICGNTAEVYRADSVAWQASCDSKHWDCNFSISCSDPLMVRRFWNELARDKISPISEAQ